MKPNTLLLLFITITFILLSSLITRAQEEYSLFDKLSEIPGFDIKALTIDTLFNEKYEVFLEQPVDHKDTSKGYFTQRFIVSHRDTSRPVVFVTEGYGAGYALYPGYFTELGGLLEANEIIVEHRYFPPSSPSPPDWQYLTVENAAADHHKVIEIMKTIYPGKWVSTGISKGGQTAMYHRTYYPDDVDGTLGYVCPLNFSNEDLRVYDFLENVGDSTCRANIFAFQKMLLSNKDKSFPAFKEMVKEQDLHYSMGLEAGFELLVLEYSFAFWQWGFIDCNAIPGEDMSAEEWIDHLDRVTGIDWVSEEGLVGGRPFFYQALTEIGMYGYDLEPFGDIVTALKDNTFAFTCPEGYDCTYNPIPMQEVDHYIRHEAENMIFIYGERDPWSATRVQWSGNPGVKVFVNPRGSHRTRIGSLPEEDREEVLEMLRDWVQVK